MISSQGEITTLSQHEFNLPTSDSNTKHCSLKPLGESHESPLVYNCYHFPERRPPEYVFNVTCMTSGYAEIHRLQQSADGNWVCCQHQCNAGIEHTPETTPTKPELHAGLEYLTQAAEVFAQTVDSVADVDTFSTESATASNDIDTHTAEDGHTYHRSTEHERRLNAGKSKLLRSGAQVSRSQSDPDDSIGAPSSGYFQL